MLQGKLSVQEIVGQGLPKDILRFGLTGRTLATFIIAIIGSGGSGMSVREEKKAHGGHEDQDQQPYV
jgi:hypothetical protein